jgi:hypothetical protein
MENNQTSFIPKRDLYSKSEKTSQDFRYSPLIVISFALLIFSVFLSTGVFLYKRSLVKQAVEINAILLAKKNAFETALIDDLVKTDGAIESMKALLKDKVSIVPVFALLERQTLENVRFLSLKYSLNTEGVGVIDLEGEAISPATVALQSDNFNADPKIVKPVFSGLTINENGTAKFNFHSELKKSGFLFSDLFEPVKDSIDGEGAVKEEEVNNESPANNI